MFNAAHSSRPQGRSIHDQRIELHPAFAIEKTATSGIKRLVIFHDNDRFFDGIKSGAAPIQHMPSSRECGSHPVEMCLNHVIRNGPGTAMDKQNRINRQDFPHKK